MKRQFVMSANRLKSSDTKLVPQDFQSVADDIYELLGNTADNPELRNYLSEEELATIAEAAEILMDTARMVSGSQFQG